MLITGAEFNAPMVRHNSYRNFKRSPDAASRHPGAVTIGNLRGHGPGLTTRMPPRATARLTRWKLSARTSLWWLRTESLELQFGKIRQPETDTQNAAEIAIEQKILAAET